MRPYQQISVAEKYFSLMLVIFKFFSVFCVPESLMETLHQLKLISEGCGGFGDPPLTSECRSAQGSSASAGGKSKREGFRSASGL